MKRIPAIPEFLLFYIWEVITSNLRVAWDVLTPRARYCPEIVKVRITGLSDLQLLVLANLITMTPGTLSIDVSEDGEHLLVHDMYAGEAEAGARELEENFLKRIRRVF